MISCPFCGNGALPDQVKTWENQIQVADKIDTLIDGMFTDDGDTQREAEAEIRQLLWDNKVGFVRLAQSLRSKSE